MIRIAEVLVELHRDIVFSDIIKCTSCKAACICIGLTMRIDSSTLRKLKEMVLWRRPYAIASAILVVDALYVVPNIRESLNLIWSNGAHY